MTVLLIIIMIIAAIMLGLYFYAMYKNSKHWFRVWRISMLTLIVVLIISWLASLLMGQQFILLLALAILFIAIYFFIPYY